MRLSIECLNDRLSANAQDGTLSVVSLPEKKVLQTLRTDTLGANRPKFTPDGKTVLVSSGPELVVLDAAFTNREGARADRPWRLVQELVTEYCWGDVWTRPGLARRERSIINLSLLTALNRPSELRLHIRGAVNNGLSHEEIGEVLLQTAIYCGVAIRSPLASRDANCGNISSAMGPYAIEEGS